MKKLIRYRLGISVKFPATHPRKGEPTGFISKILCGIKQSDLSDIVEPKIHTIRKNYPLWQKRFEKIEKGEAVLELYYWSGKPYNSKCVTICQLSKEDKIGIQELNFKYKTIYYPLIDNSMLTESFDTISKNDGLSHEDFIDWFKNYDLSEPMAIIHFTKFRY